MVIDVRCRDGAEARHNGGPTARRRRREHGGIDLAVRLHPRVVGGLRRGEVVSEYVRGCRVRDLNGPEMR